MSLRDVMKKFVVLDEQGEQPGPEQTPYYAPEPPAAPPPPAATYAPPAPPAATYGPPAPPAATQAPPSPPAATYAAPAPATYETPPAYTSPPSPTLPPTVLIRQPAPAPAPAAPVPALSGDELAAIYQQAGIPLVAWGAEDALNFIAEQPVEEPDAAVRRSLLGCIRSLSRTFPGLTPEAVAEDARLKALALANAGAEQSANLTRDIAKVEAEIAALKEQIQQRLKSIDAARAKDLQLTQRLREHTERLKKVEEFLRPGA
jgi:hypothetical protein